MTDTATHDQLVDTLTGGLALPESRIQPFAGSARLRPDGRPRPEFRAELRRIPNVRNSFLVAAVVAYPATVCTVAVMADHPAVWIAAFLIMGAWFQRSLTLFHEASHRLLFTNKMANDWVGERFIGWLTFGDGSKLYRLAHSQHHRDEFGPREPDFALYARYPIPRDSMRRKLLRDAFGVSGWKNVKPALVGLLKAGRRARAAMFLGGQAIIFGIFALFGQPWLYLFLWLAPWLTYWRVFNRLRALAEHGGMTQSDDRRRTTHHIRQGWLSRNVFLSQSIGYHLAHHVDSGIPMSNLPKLQAALDEDGYITDAITYPSYRAFLRTLVQAD